MWFACFFKYLGLAFAVLSGIRWILRKRWGSVDRTNEISCKGKMVVVTGGNAGIGRASVLEFARRDANVILACRDLDKARDAVAWVRSRTTLGQLICMHLDLASLESVRKFAKEYTTKYERLDILVNNAGVMIPHTLNKKTVDGFEMNMGVNHLGHFLLTNLLLEPLKKAAPSRIVVLSSMAHSYGTVDMADLMSEKKKIRSAGMKLYSNSKLANALFSKELAKRLQGTGVRTYALCPGMVITELGQHLSGPLLWLLTAFSPVIKYLLKTPEEGATTTLYCALSKNLINESGKMYSNCKEWSQATRVTLNDDLARELWEESARLVAL